MSKKSRRKRKQERRRPSSRQSSWLWLAVGAALLLIGGGLVWTWFSPHQAATPEVTGAPRLAVERTIVDEGYVKFNIPIRTTFRLSNVGDQPLKILGKPQVELVKGC